MTKVKFIKTEWRPILELTEIRLEPNKDDANKYTVVETGNKVHFNIVNVPKMIITNDGFSVISYDHFSVFVKESAKDIYKAIDGYIEAERDKKAAEAREYYESLQKEKAAN